MLISYGPYGKGLHFEDGYKTAWDIMARDYPDTVREHQQPSTRTGKSPIRRNGCRTTTSVVRVDQRGAGRSPGVIDHHSMRETEDFAACIEWAGTQAWSQRQGRPCRHLLLRDQPVARRRPCSPRTSPRCASGKGYADRYRDSTHHGGIVSTFQKHWQDMQVKTVQHGVGERGKKSRVTGELVCGPETLPEEELDRNRGRCGTRSSAHEFDDDYYKVRSAHWDKVTVPLLSCGNWGGNGLHLRGNVEGFVRAASEQKWLEMHGGSHWAIFYTDYANELQRRFFDYFLKGEQNGWDDAAARAAQHPPSGREVRHPARERMAARAHAMDEALPRPGGQALSAEPGNREDDARASKRWAMASRSGRSRWRRRPKSPARSRPSCSSRRRRATPTCSWSSGCSTRRARR